MTLFTYPKSPCHTRADTDCRIAESLSRYFTDSDKNPAAYELLRTEAGKPYFKSGFPTLGVTHSDSIVIIAFHDEPFGIDCEDADRKISHRDALCKRFFSKAERTSVENAGSDDEKTRCFLEIWVKKEAYVKYTGRGLPEISQADTSTLPGRFENRSDKNHILYIYYPKS